MRLGMLGALLLATACSPQTHAAESQAAAGTGPSVEADAQLRDVGTNVRLSAGTLSLRLIDDNVLHVHFIPTAGATPPTLVMAPHAAGPPGTSVVATPQDAEIGRAHV